jgi:branched-chain amino acid transport system permease protein
MSTIGLVLSRPICLEWWRKKMDWNQLLQLLTSGLILGVIYALIAVGFIVVYSVTGIMNFAQGEFVMLGALMSVSLYSMNLPVFLALLLSIALVMGLAMLMQRLAIRPAKNSSLVTFIIITIGISIAIRGAALLIWGTSPHSLPSFSGKGNLQFFQVYIAPQGLWVLGITLVAFFGLYLFFERTYLGKVVKACVINPNAAQLMGISPQAMSLLVFAIAGGMGALAGVVITPITLASYDMGLMLGLKGFVAAVLGGLSSVHGALLGGILLGVLESLGAGYLSSGYKDAVAFIILVLILFVKPNGLLGKIGGKRV